MGLKIPLRKVSTLIKSMFSLLSCRMSQTEPFLKSERWESSTISSIFRYLYLSRVITAASKQILLLVFDDFFFANLYFLTFSNITGSLSITRFYIQTVNCIEAPAFTSFISSYFFFAWQTLPLRFLWHNLICQKHSIPRRHCRSARCTMHCP